MFLIILLSLIIGLVGVWTLIYLHHYRYIHKIPSPRIWPIVGNAFEFKTPSETLEILMNLYRNLNTKTIRLQLGFRTMVQTRDYDFLEYVLTSQTTLSKAVTYSSFHKWLGKGLLTADGARWHTHRKMITPTFHFQILEQFVDVFNNKGNIMIDKLSKEAGRASFDIYPYITLCTLDIICETAMGTCVDAQNNESSLYPTCVKKMALIMQLRAFNPLYHSKFLYKFSKVYQEEEAALKVLHGYTDDVIKKRREELLNEQNSGTITEQTDEDWGRKKRIAFLDMLLQANINGVPLTNEEIREEVDTFMFEGHDTTASAICFALYSLAAHPECQQKAFDELYEIFGSDKSRDCTIKDLQEMKYMEKVIKETLRLYPSVPFYARQPSENITYKDFVIPKGMTISIFAYGIQRDPEYFPNPEKFDPERFSPENYNGKQPFSFIPFSAGPRNCIGQKFAMFELKATISKILRHYELRPATPKHTLQLAAESILRATNGVNISIHKRRYH